MTGEVKSVLALGDCLKQRRDRKKFPAGEELIMVSFYKPGAASSHSSAEVTHLPCLLNHGCRNIQANC